MANRPLGTPASYLAAVVKVQLPHGCFTARPKPIAEAHPYLVCNRIEKENDDAEQTSYRTRRDHRGPPEGNNRMTELAMTQMPQATGGGRLSGELYKVVELILDRGLVIDVFVQIGRAHV